MIYIAKARWNDKAILDKLQREADGIEIQLFEDDFDTILEHSYVVPDRFSDYKIDCLHVPLNAKTEFDYEIDTYEGKLALTKTAELAQKCVEKFNKKMNIVCHMGLSISRLQKMNCYEDLLSFVERLSIEYSDITFCVENITSRLAHTYDNVRFVEQLDLPNVRTTLDTCHALITQYQTGLLTQLGKDETERYKYQTLEKAFAKNHKVCSWIHLNNASIIDSSYGCGKGHGTPFTESDLEQLTEILQLYNLYTPDATLCLEVKEQDYYNCMNFSKTKEMCQKVFEKINI